MPFPVLLFRPEVGAESPLWDASGFMVWLEAVGIPVALADECEAWARQAVDDDTPELTRKGFELFNRLRELLGDRYLIAWEGPIVFAR